MRITIEQGTMTQQQQAMAFVIAQRHIKKLRLVKQHTYETKHGNFQVKCGKTVIVRMV